MKTKEQIRKMAVKYSEAFENWGTARAAYETGYEQAQKDAQERLKAQISLTAEFDDRIKELQEREAKLIECVKFYADITSWEDAERYAGTDRRQIRADAHDILHPTLEKRIIAGGLCAREVLKELGLG